MLSLVARATPWRALTALATGATALGALAPLLGGGPGLVCLFLVLVVLGCAGGLVLDDAAAAVVDACPVGRPAQRLQRAVVASPLVAIGLGASLAWWWREGATRMLLLQLAGCLLLGYALAALGRLRVDEPGDAVASGLGIALLGAIAFPPMAQRLRLFADYPDRRGVLLWCVLVAGSVVALLLAVPERRWRAR